MLLASCRRSLDSKSPGILLGSGTIPEGAIYIAHNIRHTVELCSKVAPIRAILTPACPVLVLGKHLPPGVLNPERIFTQDILVSEAKAKVTVFMSLTLKKGSQFGNQWSGKWDWFYVILNVWFWFNLVLFSQLSSLTSHLTTTFPNSPTPVYLASCSFILILALAPWPSALGNECKIFWY